MSLRGLDGKVAVVTGGASGIGEATVRRLSSEGVRTVIVDLNRDKAEAVAGSLPAPTEIVIGDVSREETADAWVAAAVKAWGRLDYVHNNAAAMVKPQPLADWTLEQFDAAVNVNLRGTFIGMQRGIRQMLKQESGGAIVNTAALAGVYGFSGIAGYVAAKHGVVGMTRTAATDYATRKIRVNVVCPGFVLTPLNIAGLKAANAFDAALDEQPMKRGGEPDEIAATVAWLLSDEASFISGAVLAADGAYSASIR